MTKNRNSKQYDLEDRTLKFSKDVRSFVKKLPKTIGNIEDGKQLIFEFRICFGFRISIFEFLRLNCQYQGQNL